MKLVRKETQEQRKLKSLWLVESRESSLTCGPSERGNGGIK